MTSRDFCYWLQGYFEVLDSRRVSATELMRDLNAAQVAVVRNHLALVFKHEIDPSAGPPEHQQELDAIHNAKPHPKIGGIDPLTGMVFRC